MERITSDTEIEEFKRDYGIDEGSKRRESELREQQLRKFAQLRSKNPHTDLRLTRDPYKGFAHTEKEEDELDGEQHTIEVTKNKVPQAITDLPGEYFDYLVQKGLTIHEVGHILYTDWPSLEQEMNKVPKNDQQIFKDWWNAFEDGTLEKKLRENYRVSDEIDLIRGNMAEISEPGETASDPTGEEKQYFYMSDAISSAIYDLAVWNTGTLQELLEPDGNYELVSNEDQEKFNKFLPTVRAYVDAITTEDDPEIRNQYCRKFYEEAKPLLDESDASGRGQDSGNPNSEMPDDAHEGHGSAKEGDQSGGGGGSQESDGDEQEQQGGGEPTEVGDGDKKLPGEERADNAPDAQDWKEEAEEGLQQEDEEAMGDGLEDEVETYINAMGAGDGHKELVVPEDNEINTETYNRAKRRARLLTQTLEERLRMQRKAKTRRNLDRGDFDPKNMIKAARGLPDVFVGEEDTGDKDYRVVIVKDSSGSTSGFGHEIEEAAGTLCMALENVGVDTSLLDVQNSQIQLAKPFGGSTEQYRENVFNGEFSGGTPLRHAIWFARERMKFGDADNEFLIVLTDGKPARGEQYREELRKCGFPVIGLYIDKGRSRSKEAVEGFRDDFDYFHNQGVVFKDEDTLTHLRGLIRRTII